MDNRPMRNKFAGLVLDGEHAGEWRTHDAPYMRLSEEGASAGMLLCRTVEETLQQPQTFRSRGYVYAAMTDYTPVGFWIAQENATSDPTVNSIYALRRLLKGFRPRSEDPQRRIRDAERELDAALQAAYQPKKRSA